MLSICISQTFVAVYFVLTILCRTQILVDLHYNNCVIANIVISLYTRRGLILFSMRFVEIILNETKLVL